MEPSKNKNEDGQPLPIVETDVLGLAKNTGTTTNVKSNPNRIFIALAILAAIAAIYWWFNR